MRNGKSTPPWLPVGFVSALLATVLVAVTSVGASLFLVTAREVATRTYYGFPLPWLVEQEPNQAVATLCPGTVYEFSIVSLAFDLAIWFAASFIIVNRLYRRGTKPRPPEPRCSHCGYSLIGLVTGRCPECGTRFDAERQHGDEHA